MGGSTTTAAHSRHSKQGVPLLIFTYNCGMIMMNTYMHSYNVKIIYVGGNRFVYMANPNMLENILRAEGRYPRRENTLSPNLEWILAKLKLPPPFAIKCVYVAIAIRTNINHNLLVYEFGISLSKQCVVSSGCFIRFLLSETPPSDPPMHPCSSSLHLSVIKLPDISFRLGN